MPLYRAAINFSYRGQEMTNILWYRDTGSTVGLVGIVAQQTLATAVRDNVVLGGIAGQTRLADLLPNTVRLDEVSVQYVSAPDRIPLTNAPSVANIALNALLGGPADGPARVAIQEMICPAITVAPADYTPKRGYLAVGPLADDVTDSDGILVPAWLTSFNNFGAALIQVQSLGAGFTATPIRVGRGRNSFGALTNGFNDIQTVSPRPLSSFRRSRQPQ